MHPSPASTPLLQRLWNTIPSLALQLLQQPSPPQMVSKWGHGKQHAFMTAAQRNSWHIVSVIFQVAAGRTLTLMDTQALQNSMIL